jgi:hypothetical protein
LFIPLAKFEVLAATPPNPAIIASYDYELVLEKEENHQSTLHSIWRQLNGDGMKWSPN